MSVGYRGEQQGPPPILAVGSFAESADTVELLEATAEPQDAAEIRSVLLRNGRIQSRLGAFASDGWMMAWLLVGMVVNRLRGGPEDGWLQGVYGYMLVAAIAVLAANVLSRKRRLRRVTRTDDVRYVGLILEIWSTCGVADSLYNFGHGLPFDPITRHMASSALARLLPHVTAAEAPLLHEGHRETLRRILARGGYIGFRRYRSPDLIIAAMQALVQVGDRACLSPISNVADLSKVRRVRDTARSLLRVAIQLRPASGNHSLLRAAACPGDARGQLLRPADYANDSAPAELLRVSGAGMPEPPRE